MRLALDLHLEVKVPDRIIGIVRELALIPFYPVAAVSLARKIDAGKWTGRPASSERSPGPPVDSGLWTHDLCPL